MPACYRMLLLALAIVTSSPVVADQPVLILDKDPESLSIDGQLWFLEDADHSHTPEQFSDAAFQKGFAALDRRTPNFGLSSSTFWARVPLQNPSARPLTVLVTQGHAQIDSVEFWQLTSDGRIVAKAQGGDRMNREGDTVPYRLPNFRMLLPPGDSWPLIRIRTQGSAIMNIKLHSESALNNRKTFEYALIFTVMGILVTMALYNLFIWVQLRKATYLVYVFFVLAMALQPFISTGLAYLLLNNEFFVNEGFVIISNLTVALACIFTAQILSLRKRHPWLNRLCWLGAVVGVGASGVVPFSMNLSVKILIPSSFLFSLVLLFSGAISCWKRFRPAYFFTLAWLVVLVANAIRNAVLGGSISSSIAAPFVAEWGVAIGSVFEVILLSMALADKIRLAEKAAFVQIEGLNDELKREHEVVVSLNNNLERMVEEQTREIKSILRHIQIGILVIRHPSHQVTETHSQSARQIFQTEAIAGRDAVDLIFSHAVITQELRSQVQSVLDNCLGEDAVNFEINAHLLPLDLRCLFGNEEKFLQLDWNPVVDKDGRIEKLLVSIKDVTSIRQLEPETEAKAQELACIGEILEVSARQFGIFIHSAQRFLSDNVRLLRGNLKPEREVIKILFINLHTIKGAARALNLKHLTPVLHEAEQRLAGVMKAGREWSRDELLHDAERVQRLLNQYEYLNQTKLGRNSTDAVSLGVDILEKMVQTLQSMERDGAVGLPMRLRTLRETVESFTFVRAESIFREVLSNAEMLARDLNKESPTVAITDAGIQLSMAGQELIRNAFIHIIRNSMDHGIESQSERSRKGKDPAGRIEVQLATIGADLEIRYRDDGRGLNLRTIRRLALARGLIKEQQKLGLQDVADLIFEPGFSTCEATTEISGRGVGMSAVKEYFEACGGSARILLQVDESVIDPEFVPFVFVFRIGPAIFIQKNVA